MKFAYVLILSLSLGNAALAGEKKTLKCASLDKDVLVKIASIEMIPANAEEGIDAEWINHEVTINWLDQFNPKKAIKQKDAVKMKYQKVIDRMGYLTGWFPLGGDFGDVAFMLFHDYDKNEVIVLADIATDGPIRKEIHRCKVK